MSLSRSHDGPCFPFFGSSFSHSKIRVPTFANFRAMNRVKLLSDVIFAKGVLTWNERGARTEMAKAMLSGPKMICV
jgi:hypothetical protein